MKRWEDIFKDKLGGMEIPLPEGSLAEFRSRLDEVENTSPVRRFPLGWVIAAAVVAGLAAILFLRQPNAPENNIQFIRQSESPLAVVSDSIVVSETVPGQTLIAQDPLPKPIVHPVLHSKEPIIKENPVEEEEIETNKPEDYPVDKERMDTVAHETPDIKIIDNQRETTKSPFIPNDSGKKDVRLKVGPAASIVVGGSLLAAYISSSLRQSRSTHIPIHNDPIDPDQQKDILTDYSHNFPLILGLSTKFPLAEKISLTSGLDYSVYSSMFSYSTSGEKKQVVHYIGIPVRLDLSIASNRWLDVYVGAGLRGDYCIDASLAGTPVKKDGLSFSILGSGGIQFNATKRLGLYVEPEICYLIPNKTYHLETYRTSSPLLFTVKSGVRINLSK